MKKLILICAMGSTIAFGQNFEWAKGIGGSGDDRGNVVRLDASGNIYIAGSFSETVDFDPGVGVSNLTSTGEMDLFVAKYDANGNFLWVQSDGNIYDDLVLDMAVDASGNAHITGYGEIVSDGSERAMFVAKLDASGNTSWEHSFYSDNNNVGGYSLAIDATGNVYVGGNFNGNVSFDPDPGSSVGDRTSTGNLSMTDGYILKLTSGGIYDWVQQFAVSNANASVNSIAIDVSGNIYSTGQYWNNAIDCDPGPGTEYLSNSGNGDIFISKLNSSGDYVWGKSIGGGSTETGFSIAVDNLGVYATGYFEGTVDFDPGTGTNNIASAGSRDAFIVRLDLNGEFDWAHGIGSTGDDRGNELTTDGAGNIYTVGVFEETVDFDPEAGTHNLTSLGDKDVFVSKLNNNGVFQWANSFGAASPPMPVPGFSASDFGNSIVLGASDTIYTTGNFVETVDFDFGAGTSNIVSNNGTRDVFFTKWSQNTSNVGIDEKTSDLFNVYPNPVKNTLFFENQLGAVTIMDLSGKVIYQNAEEVSSVDVSFLQSGTYIVTLDTKQETATIRIIKD